MNKYQLLRERRRLAADVPTDSQGNLLLNNPHKQSGKKWRSEHTNGVFYKRDSNHNHSTVMGTYTQYAANMNSDADAPAERRQDADARVE
jgi:hypothetical protein